MEHEHRSLRSRAARLAIVAGVAGFSCLAATSPGTEQPPPPKPKGSATAPAAPLGRIILQWDHIKDSNDNTFEDYWGFLSYKQAHVQAWYGDFTKGGEIGGYLKDHRRSTYSAFYRYRKDFDHVVEFDTEQILKKGFVLAGLVRGIRVIPDDPTVDRNEVQFGTGLDYYWGDYDFASFRAITDPRQGGRWSFIGSARFYRGEPIYVQPGLVKHTDGATGWFVQGKIKLFRWSVGKYDQFDWTAVDRTIYSAGLEWTY